MRKVWGKKRPYSKTALVRQKIFRMVILVICCKILFHLYQPTFGRDEFFFLFFPFFSSKILYTLLLNRKTSKSNFCVKLLSYKRNFVSRFLASLAEPPQNGRLYGTPKRKFVWHPTKCHFPKWHPPREPFK